MTSPPDRRLLWLVPVILAGLSMLGPFSIDTPFPAFREMGADFDVTSDEMQLVVSAYLVSFGLMSPFHGPLSDALGRKPVIIGGVTVYVLASIGCALSPTLESLLVFRVLQGLSAGGGVIVSRTVIRDVFEGPEAQRLMSRVMMIFSLAPAIAPVIGGVLLQAGPWPIAFWFMAVAALLLVAVVVVCAARDPPVRSAGSRCASARWCAGSPSVARSARFHRVAWSAALIFGGQFIYVSAASIIVVDLLGLGELDFWMLFAPLVGAVLDRVPDQQLGSGPGAGQPSWSPSRCSSASPRRSGQRRGRHRLRPGAALGGAGPGAARARHRARRTRRCS